MTNHRGIAKPVTIDAPPGLPGIEFGLYRVQITHDSRGIPSRYNSKTELGFELSPLERNRDTFEILPEATVGCQEEPRGSDKRQLANVSHCRMGREAPGWSIPACMAIRLARTLRSGQHCRFRRPTMNILNP